jgi:hypothetical protein
MAAKITIMDVIRILIGVSPNVSEMGVLSAGKEVIG